MLGVVSERRSVSVIAGWTATVMTVEGGRLVVKSDDKDATWWEMTVEGRWPGGVTNTATATSSVKVWVALPPGMTPKHMQKLDQLMEWSSVVLIPAKRNEDARLAEIRELAASLLKRVRNQVEKLQESGELPDGELADHPKYLDPGAEADLVMQRERLSRREEKRMQARWEVMEKVMHVVAQTMLHNFSETDREKAVERARSWVLAEKRNRGKIEFGGHKECIWTCVRFDQLRSIPQPPIWYRSLPDYVLEPLMWLSDDLKNVPWSWESLKPKSWKPKSWKPSFKFQMPRLSAVVVTAIGTAMLWGYNWWYRSPMPYPAISHKAHWEHQQYLHRPDPQQDLWPQDCEEAVVGFEKALARQGFKTYGPPDNAVVAKKLCPEATVLFGNSDWWFTGLPGGTGDMSDIANKPLNYTIVKTDAFGKFEKIYSAGEDQKWHPTKEEWTEYKRELARRIRERELATALTVIPGEEVF
ncbi:hypothetical protein GNI_182910 [Gregarina niphandrodes]|uniref:Uncharacterized protein n=1 Tax=Gregarina niphandrodes TaxID=110365 RepID=A0A023AWS8_GRENI|nr:hypothetical protein GNI_182910 [Gregarina niphandrodes]EZG43201.1 hypothetical protein GNI_182910 [Gregarina niphandrodes]|eukprot:XP_011133544.1 hypothetical protein GNI_182910 [Gregarina niphandrodes]